MLALTATSLGLATHGAAHEAGDAVRELAIGVVLGLALGIGGALLVTLTTRHGWTGPGGRRLAVFALAVAAYAVAVAIEGNGFIAAFVAGGAFGAALDREVSDLEQVDELPELGGQLLALVVWFLFGAAVLPVALAHVDARTVGYAVLSLTVVRMAPVALSLIRSGLDGPSVVFVAWFGPRGLASVVFALLAVEELGTSSTVVNEAVATVALTVLFSVVLHGITAGPGGRQYVRREQAEAGEAPRARAVLTRRAAPAED
jgi:NhaP-type Na+/H+ or K+/H+ antiporter